MQLLLFIIYKVYADRLCVIALLEDDDLDFSLRFLLKENKKIFPNYQMLYSRLLDGDINSIERNG